MRSEILVVGAKGELGKRLTGLFEADGHEASCAVPSPHAEKSYISKNRFSAV